MADRYRVSSATYGRKDSTLTRLAELIKQRDLTVRQVASDSGVPERTVYRHLKGHTAMTLDQAAAYARALKVDLSDLVENAA